jgi:protein gp37
MSAKTGIEWSDATWNPVRGCSRVSEGCRHCYAERVAARFSGPGQSYEGLVRIKTTIANNEERDPGNKREPRWTGVVRLVPEHLADPIRWRKPRRVFVNSMSDLFHEDVPDAFIT